MKKKLYYTVEIELTEINGVKETNGFKQITMYNIDNNIPVSMGSIDCYIGNDNVDEIKDYLNDNGFEDETFEFIKL